MAIDILGDDIKVATDDHRQIFLFPGDHLVNQPIHPAQLVGEIDAAWRVAVREININDPNVPDRSFKKPRMTVGLIASEDSVDCFDGEARYNRHSVVGLLRDSDAFVTQLLEHRVREFCSLQLLNSRTSGSCCASHPLT